MPSLALRSPRSPKPLLCRRMHLERGRRGLDDPSRLCHAFYDGAYPRRRPCAVLEGDCAGPRVGLAHEWPRCAVLVASGTRSGSLRCVVGTTVKSPEHLPKDLVADQRLVQGARVSIATTARARLSLGGIRCPVRLPRETWKKRMACLPAQRRPWMPRRRRRPSGRGLASHAGAWPAPVHQVTGILCFIQVSGGFCKPGSGHQTWAARVLRAKSGCGGRITPPSKRAFAQAYCALRAWAETDPT